jgi:hypothetical protein
MKDADSRAAFLAEVPDGAASADLNAIFSDIKRLWAIDSPALFFRALAAIPGALPQCWKVLATHASSGHMQQAATAVTTMVESRLTTCNFEQISTESLCLSGVEWGHIENALASYNRANPMNLMAVAILTVRGAGSPNERPCTADQSVWQPSEKLALSTTMLGVESIGAVALESIDRLALDSDRNPDTVSCVAPRAALVPSLYRHLARYPAFLRFAAEVLDSGHLRQQLAGLVDSARVVALERADAILAPSRLSSQRIGFSDDVDSLVRRFLVKVPEMVVMGVFLRRLIPGIEFSTHGDQR